MPIDTEILLCDCSAGFDDTRRFARLDELTLTYDVVEREGAGAPRVLRRHVASLRAARLHACATRTDGVRCPFGLDAPKPTDDDICGLTAIVAELAALARDRVAGGRAQPGTVVRVADQAGQVSDFELADAPAPAVERQTVAVTSPIGRELLGAGSGDWVCITVANGRRKRVQIVDILSRVDERESRS